MINLDEIIYKAKNNGYYFYHDGSFISVFDEDITINKNAQCLYRNKVDCPTKKDFEMEAIFASSKINEM